MQTSSASSAGALELLRAWASLVLAPSVPLTEPPGRLR